jgi:cation transport ATPase
MKRGILKIKGPFCGACTYAIEKAARRLKEVEEIRVNTGTELITVSYQGDESVLEKVKEIVSTLGHEAEITTPGKER